MKRDPKRKRLRTPLDYTAWVMFWTFAGWLAYMLLKP
jgi:hypothetical protein